MPESSITHTQDGTVIFTGDAVAIYQAMAVRQGLKACKIGMRLNIAYTPKNLMSMVTKITGKTFTRGKYDEAISAVDEWILQARSTTEIKEG